MISLPFGVTDYRVRSVYPTVTSDAFTYQGSYVICDTLQNGPGYWARFDSSQSIDFATAVPITNDTIPVMHKWNMIGSISTPIAVSSIISIPGGLVTSPFYKYTGTYIESDSILPGEAYWVKVNQPGSLILSAPASIATGIRIRISPNYETPPSPPNERENLSDFTPPEYTLYQAYPNPFNPVTTIRYGLPNNSDVTISVFNTLGEEVAILVDGHQDAGYHEVTFTAEKLSSGVYFYKISAGDYTQTKKLVLMK